MTWITDNTMRSVLARQCPDLAPTVTKLPNAFGIWDRARVERPVPGATRRFRAGGPNMT